MIARVLLAFLATTGWSAAGFQILPPSPARRLLHARSSSSTRLAKVNFRGPASSSTCIAAKLWDRLQIEEDPEPFWYLLNCVAGLEMDLLRQCREQCEGMEDVVKFVVPTERKTRSHGANRMVTETKVKYQGYVFAKLRLCPEVYEAIQSLDLCRSWMGTVNHKGYKKLPPAPVALNELEVENFGLEDEEFEEEEDDEEEDGIIVDSEDAEASKKDEVDQEALKVYLGLKVEDMVKVTNKGKFYGEDGIVRRLKDGRILVRFFTYGTMFEEWMEPGDVRKLSGEEILRGLGGPSRPVTQRDFDDPFGRNDNSRYSGDGSRRGLRQNLMSNVKGARGPRNRRWDRMERGDTMKRDIFGRTEQERRREERNWKWYQERQRNQEGRGRISGQVDDKRNFRAGSRSSQDDWAAGDVDSQWGRPSQRKQRREQRRNTQDNRKLQSAVEGADDWSAFVSPSPSPSNSEEDDFFASLMSDLSEDLSNKKSGSEMGRGDSKSQNDDDFFASLMSELSTETSDSKSSKDRPSSRDDDDFFASLEAELGGAFESDGSGTSSDDTDDFFAKLEAEMAPDFAEKEHATQMDDFLSDTREEVVLMDNLDSEAEKKPQPAENAKVASHNADATQEDLSKYTVPILKDMLRERGLKVSGKKSELIERLQQS